MNHRLFYFCLLSAATLTPSDYDGTIKDKYIKIKYDAIIQEAIRLNVRFYHLGSKDQILASPIQKARLQVLINEEHCRRYPGNESVAKALAASIAYRDAIIFKGLK